jgi:predicted DNA-binding protein (UPF0251 family)
MNGRGRKRRRRNVSINPKHRCFKPCKRDFDEIGFVELGVDEIEALRLIDYLDLYQEESSRIMNISRATFGRIAQRARQKVADALINGKAIIVREE